MAQTRSKTKAISYTQAIEQLNKGVISLNYFIFGEEKYLHDDLVDRIINASINPSNRDFNLDFFYANEAEVDKIINVARSFPMMDQRRVVIVKDIQDLKTTELKYLTDYISHPSQTSCLILTMAEKIRSNKSMDLLLTHAVAIDCRQFYDNEIPAWVENYLQSKKIEIEMQAIYLLQAQVGNSLLNLVNELEKVQINIHPRTKITLADIQSITSISKQFNIFELCNAVGDKSFPRAAAILSKLLQQGEMPTGMIVQLTRHFVHLLKIHEAMRQGKKTVNDVMKITGLTYYFVNDIMRQSKNFSPEQLRNVFNHLADADLHLKTGYQKPGLVMELLLYKLIHG